LFCNTFFRVGQGLAWVVLSCCFDLRSRRGNQVDGLEQVVKVLSLPRGLYSQRLGHVFTRPCVNHAPPCELV